MNNDKYNQILSILESNDTRCMDDKVDREELASVLVLELFPDVFYAAELEGAD